MTDIDNREPIEETPLEEAPIDESAADEGAEALPAAEEGDDEGGEPEGGAAFVMPDKFKGKSAEEIARSYTELEGSLEQRVIRTAHDTLRQMGIDPTNPGAAAAIKKDIGQASEDDQKDLEEYLEKTDFTKVSPKEFAKGLYSLIQKNSLQNVQRYIQKTQEVQANITAEIRAVSKEYPQIKENADFRELVIGYIDAAAGQGKQMSLKDACAKAAKYIPATPATPAKPQEKKPSRTGVERSEPSAGGEKSSEEDEINASILNAGTKPSALGGLGG